MSNTVEVTLTMKPARTQPLNVPGFEYHALTSFNVAGMPTLPEFTGWRMTRTIVPGPAQTMKVQFPQAAATRLHQFVQTCFVEGHRGYSSFSLVRVLLNDGGLFSGGCTVSAIPASPSAVQAGKAYAAGDAEGIPQSALIGLAPNRGLTYSPRGLGPAVVDIPRYLRGASLYEVLGRAS